MKKKLTTKKELCPNTILVTEKQLYYFFLKSKKLIPDIFSNWIINNILLNKYLKEKSRKNLIKSQQRQNIKKIFMKFYEVKINNIRTITEKVEDHNKLLQNLQEESKELKISLKKV